MESIIKAHIAATLSTARIKGKKVWPINKCQQKLQLKITFTWQQKKTSSLPSYSLINLLSLLCVVCHELENRGKQSDLFIQKRNK